MQLSTAWLTAKTCDGCGRKSEQPILGKPETYFGPGGAPEGWQMVRVGYGDASDETFYICSGECVSVVLDKARDAVAKQLQEQRKAWAERKQRYADDTIQSEV